MSKPSRAKRHQYMTRNRLKPCAVPGCIKPRREIAKHCRQHALRARLYGHTEGRSLPHRDLKAWRSTADKFLTQYADTTQVQTAISVMNDLLAFGVADPHGNRELVRLRSNGVDGKEALAAALGCWLLAAFDPRLLADDARLTFYLGIVLFKLRPAPISMSSGGHTKYRVSNGSARRVVGEAVRSRLIPFLVRAVEAINIQARRSGEQHRAMSQPFSTETVH